MSLTRARLVLPSGGTDRRAYAVAPTASARDVGPLPLVLTCHGSGSTAVEQLALSGLEAIAQRHGVLVVAPEGALRTGVGYAWAVPHTPGAEAGPDDAAFLLALVDRLVAGGYADPTRVYATGLSGGARLVCQLAGDHPDRVAAVGAVAGLRAGAPDPARPAHPDPATWSPDQAVPVVAFHGTADTVNPYAGGGRPYWGYPVEEALARWAARRGLAGPPLEDRVSPHVVRVAYDDGAGDRPVQLYRVSGGGHTWPGSRAPVPPGMGAVTAEIDATATMWTFFAGRRTR